MKTSKLKFSSESKKKLDLEYGTHVERIKSLSDGVIAIALTLLVLELRPPVESLGSNAKFIQYLEEESQKIITYLVSFFLVMVYWLAHHRMFSHIKSYNRKLLWYNAFFLFWVSFLPFPSAILGRQGGIQFAWIFYSLSVAATGFSTWLIWTHGTRSKLIDADLDPRVIVLISRRALVPPMAFLLSIAVSFVDVSVAHFVPLLIIPALKLISSP